MKTKTLSELLGQYKVVIPPIQRDYAQGRNQGKIPHIREKFIKDIAAILQKDDGAPLELDFIYGFEEKDKTSDSDTEIRLFKPLDGQQRLTTLFLLHWFVAIGIEEEKLEAPKKLLHNFSYATRKSSRDFCEKLVEFIPEKINETIVEQIINQPWFFSSWLSDPTIKSMLVVIDSMEINFGNTEGMWEKLTGSAPRIIFHLLPMQDLGLPDDLYIKMNARGKGLTDFEHFKSRFSEILDEENGVIFNNKIDSEWSDLFWNLFKDKESKDIAKEVDNGFLSFFWYISDILIKKNKLSISSEFWLDQIKEIYKGKPENIDFLFKTLNLFEIYETGKYANDDANKYFEDLFYIQPNEFDKELTRIFFQNPQVNLFKKCAETYGFHDKKGAFSVGEQLLLYAFIYMKLKDSFNAKVFRFLRNIFSSSEDQLRNEYLSSFLYDDIEYIVDNFNDVLENNSFSANSKLSKRQCAEEYSKRKATEEYPELRETINKIEDHNLLRGNIAILGWDVSLKPFADKFESVFDTGCNYLEISSAMLTIADYSQTYRKNSRYGNKTNSTWRELLTQSENRVGFENTKEILKKYLKSLIDVPSLTNEQIINQYLVRFEEDVDKPKDFLYYKIKYNEFTLWGKHQTQGFFYWEDKKTNPYCCSMLFATMFGGRHWDPFLLQINAINENCSLENYGNLLQYTNNDIIVKVGSVNQGFKFTSTDELSSNYINSLIESERLDSEGVLIVAQDDIGNDIEDRIEKCSTFLNELKELAK